MKTIHSFNVYSFFVLGLLIGAFSVFFFMASQSQSGTIDEGVNFGTQSYEADIVTLPNSGFITNAEAFDQECVSVNCAADCASIGKSERECKNLCQDTTCENYVADIKAGNTETNNAAAEKLTTIPGFNIGAQKRVASDEVRNSEVNERATAGGNISNVGFDYNIDNNRYNSNCEQHKCVDYCIGIKGEGAMKYCSTNCISNTCLDVKARGNMEASKVR